ncbi:hypothetical protein CEXT_619401 [Caerostris extrusa]|uniref:Uncharacterized protein n=1 Tax=Caerostris extrusa TaxID=172846 RepID=A0AAV4Y5W7_CAEEX|nr:hypothetical protein CEXT_619401 [Caerostris extrusa]
MLFRPRINRDPSIDPPPSTHFNQKTIFLQSLFPLRTRQKMFSMDPLVWTRIKTKMTDRFILPEIYGWVHTSTGALVSGAQKEDTYDDECAPVSLAGNELKRTLENVTSPIF